MKTKYLKVYAQSLIIGCIYYDSPTEHPTQLKYKGRFGNLLIFEQLTNRVYNTLSMQDCRGLNIPYIPNLVMFSNIELPFYKRIYLN